MKERLFSETKGIILKYKEARILHQIKPNNDLYNFVRDVEIAYYSLKPKERFFLYNEYFVESSKMWWNQFYSKEEYMSTSFLACNSFIRRFYEIH